MTKAFEYRGFDPSEFSRVEVSKQRVKVTITAIRIFFSVKKPELRVDLTNYNKFLRTKHLTHCLKHDILNLK